MGRVLDLSFGVGCDGEEVDSGNFPCMIKRCCIVCEAELLDDGEVENKRSAFWRL